MIAARTSPSAVATATSPTTTPRTDRQGAAPTRRQVERPDGAPFELRRDQRDRQIDRQQGQRPDVPRDLDEAGREREGRQLDDESVSPFGEHLGTHVGFGHGIRRVEEEVGLGRRREGVELHHEHERQDDRDERHDEPQVAPAPEADPVGGQQVHHGGGPCCGPVSRRKTSSSESRRRISSSG